MRHPKSNRPPRDRSADLTAFDRVTNAVFMAVLLVGVAAFTSYGPEAACRHIAEVIATRVPQIALTDASEYVGPMPE